MSNDHVAEPLRSIVNSFSSLEEYRDALKAELANVERKISENYHADLAKRAEAGKNDPKSMFYTGYAKDQFGYPLDPLEDD